MGTNRGVSTMSSLALEVAKYIVTKCNRDDFPVTNTRLQKILYCIQRDYFKMHDKCAFEDDFEAWPLGPIIPEVYQEFYYFSSAPITCTYADIDLNKLDVALIDSVIEDKRKLSSWELIQEIHHACSAWYKTYIVNDGYKRIIVKELIKMDA